jgi:tetratricopeptide (TPR) repeat protein
MLAHHLLEAIALGRAAGLDFADLREPAIAALIDAADRAVALNAWARAATPADSALELIGEDDPRRAYLLLTRGRASWILESSGDVFLLEAGRALEAQGDPEAAADAEGLLSRIWWSRGDSRRSEEHLAAATALVEGRPLSPTKARVLAGAARSVSISGDPRLGLELARDALPVVEELGEPEFLAHVLNTIGMARVSLGDAGGIDDLRRACELGESSKVPEAIHNAYNNLANMFWRLARLDEGTAALAQARVVDERYGYVGGLRWLVGERMLDCWLRGDWNAARQIADDVVADAAGSGHYHEAPARNHRATISLRRGEMQAALDDSERSLELARIAGDGQVVGPALATRAEVLHAAGRADEADRLLDEVFREHDLGDTFMQQLPLLFAELGRGAEFLAALKQAEALATPWIDAARAVAAGDYGGGADVYGEIGAQALEAHARLLNAETLVGAGRRAEADTELDRAIPYFRTVGASVFLRRGEALLAATA